MMLNQMARATRNSGCASSDAHGPQGQGHGQCGGGRGRVYFDELQLWKRRRPERRRVATTVLSDEEAKQGGDDEAKADSGDDGSEAKDDGDHQSKKKRRYCPQRPYAVAATCPRPRRVDAVERGRMRVCAPRERPRRRDAIGVAVPRRYQSTQDKKRKRRVAKRKGPRTLLGRCGRTRARR